MQELQTRKKGDNTMIVRVKASEIPPLTEEQIERIREASKKPIVYDEDSPEYSEEELKEMVELAKLEKQVAKEIENNRKELNMSQKELADKLNTKQSNIARFESGSYNPTIDTLKRIANAFNKQLEIKFV